jgi:2-polyprenyl-3-methyl-5-hydroxy-6-metoxy-1,4-benzoquinol methylase
VSAARPASTNRLADGQAVAADYADERSLLSRRAAAWATLDGPDADEEIVAAARALKPASVLDLGCGVGDLAARDWRTAATICAVARIPS